MKINLALSGAHGRMGKAISHAVALDPSCNLIIKLTKDNYQEQLEHLKIENKIDIFIDFSTPASCLEYANFCNKYNIPMVIGTTGFNDHQKQHILNLAKSSPILLSSNMSVGVNICKYLIGSFSRLWSEYQQNNQDTLISIKEVHHKHKKDAPSGTALSIADLINKNFLYNYQNNSRALDKKQPIPINFISKRLGDVKGTHQVTFRNIFEEISIKHKVKDRSIFAYGALLVAKWLYSKVNKTNRHAMHSESEQTYELYNFFHVMELDLNNFVL